MLLAADVERKLALAVAQPGLERVHDPLPRAALDPDVVEYDRHDTVIRMEPRVVRQPREAPGRHAAHDSKHVDVTDERSGSVNAHEDLTSLMPELQ